MCRQICTYRGFPYWKLECCNIIRKLKFYYDKPCLYLHSFLSRLAGALHIFRHCYERVKEDKYHDSSAFPEEIHKDTFLAARTLAEHFAEQKEILFAKVSAATTTNSYRGCRVIGLWNEAALRPCLQNTWWVGGWGLGALKVSAATTTKSYRVSISL